MSTDFQAARAALGARLRELRVSAPGGQRLTGSLLAERLGWPQSKVSKLENGRQTPTAEDLRAWAKATGQPEVFDELHARLQGFESSVRSWRRQLAAGHRPVQETWNSLIADTSVMHLWQNSVIPGMLQTPDYARHIFLRYAALRTSVRDTEDAVRARIKRQEWLFRPGKKFHFLVWEAALRVRICPLSVLAAQLDRLTGLIGMDTVSLGIVPFSAPLKLLPGNGFVILDERLATTEDWHAELWLDDADTVATYMRVWKTLSESAVYGHEAQQIITQARRSLDAP
ncbi:helix-turn-helix transcriptional regulator [Streptomyces sp. B1866]|uniref:helix-turn-helix domain-containing protein n=1 Tax=Streptomyces sp. B1866 TaxID=3075431 RepID=UPI00288E7AF9|nr:helix-turn-helix transcriptional regulator [Streptomyces sp. B1866]MDT3398641.1 helix-turn-helix transcriptional regulator [Streptomyces sp. B1866]